MVANASAETEIYSDSMERRLLKGLGANLVSQVLNLAAKVLLTPLFLRAWGIDLYGEWLLLSSFVAYLSLTNMGGQLYIVNRLTHAYARRDITLFRCVLHSGFALFVVLPGLVFFIFVAVISLLPCESLFQISMTAHQTVVCVLAVLAFQILFSLPQGLCLGVYRAVGRYSRGVMLGSLMQFLQLVFVGAGLLLGKGILWVACLQAVPTLLVAAIALLELDRLFPEFKLLSLREANLLTVREFIRPSLHFFGIEAAQAFSIQGIILVVGATLGPAQVVVFSTIRTLVNVMRQLVGMVAHAAWPEMTRLDALEDWDQLLTLFRAILRSTLLGAAVFATVFHFWGARIYDLWLGGGVEYSPILMDLFLVYALQLIFWGNCSYLLMAVNVHQTLSKVLLFASVLAIGLAYLGGRYFGLQGSVVGLIAGDAVLPFWIVPYLASRYQRGLCWRFYLREAFPIVGGMLCAGLLPWAIPLLVPILLLWWVRSLPGNGMVVKRLI